MDKNTIIGLVLIFAVLVGWSIYTAPSDKEVATMKRHNDSIVVLRMQDSIVALQQQAQAKIADTNITAMAHDSSAQIALHNKFGSFSDAAEGKNKYYTIENDFIKIKIASKGGRVVSAELKQYKTYDQKKLMLFTEESSKLNLSFVSGNKGLSSSELYFQPTWLKGQTENQDSIYIKKNGQVALAMRLYPDNQTDKYIEFLYSLSADSYIVDFSINFHNTNDIVAPTYQGAEFMDLAWSTDLFQQEKSVSNVGGGPTIFYKYASDDEDVDNLSEGKDESESIKTKVKWLSFKQHFFCNVFIAKDAFLNADIKSIKKTKNDPKYLRSMEALIGIPYVADNTADHGFKSQFYFGPNKYKELKKFNLDLERQIPLGWGFFLMAWINKYAVIPVFNFLEGFNINYGIIILILTILLKILLFPIAYKTYVSSAKMRVLKPEIDEIGARYPKSEDALKKQQAVMALYKKAGVNPLAGCIPMLLQFPILLALFRFFPASIELRQQHFLWADDLSAFDSIGTLPFHIPFYGDHVSLFTLLMTASTILYTYMNSQMMPTNNQLPGMKTMMYLMPIMFLFFFNDYASGLSYYYFLANMITFSQIYIIRKMIDEDKIHKQIKANQAKAGPVKKSRFQQKLEDMAKQRGMDPKTLRKK